MLDANACVAAHRSVLLAQPAAPCRVRVARAYLSFSTFMSISFIFDTFSFLRPPFLDSWGVSRKLQSAGVGRDVVVLY